MHVLGCDSGFAVSGTRYALQWWFACWLLELTIDIARFKWLLHIRGVAANTLLHLGQQWWTLANSVSVCARHLSDRSVYDLGAATRTAAPWAAVFYTCSAQDSTAQHIIAQQLALQDLLSEL